MLEAERVANRGTIDPRPDHGRQSFARTVEIHILRNGAGCGPASGAGSIGVAVVFLQLPQVAK